MKYVTLPKTDLKVSNVCMGTVFFGSTVDKKESFRVLDRFVEMGGNFFDTARVYANWVPGAEPSASEKMLGLWLKERKNSDRVVVATKGASLDGATKKPLMERSALIAQIEDSCRFLRLDVLPLYYLHRDDDGLPVSYIMDTLFSQQDRGLIRYLGCSNWRAERIAEANAYAASCGRTGFVAVSNRWSLAKCISGVGDQTLVDMDEQLFELHKSAEIAAVPFNSTAGGYLSKLSEGKPIQEGQQSLYGIPENAELAMRAKKLAFKKGVSVAQIALAYFYSQPFAVIPATAFSSDAQMDEAIAASEITLSADEYDFLTCTK